MILYNCRITTITTLAVINTALTIHEWRNIRAYYRAKKCNAAFLGWSAGREPQFPDEPGHQLAKAQFTYVSLVRICTMKTYFLKNAHDFTLVGQ